ncbi:gasdermin-E-like isoform X11 [Oncorhynchus keta]|uniref:gasdermin-E-like isoform X4 n=1 Tax=Oncorhynchus keta TaxID=8018 RepID=UPI00227B5085|nr:gasdermin-E-like isoform X4 [Oncorhynchus keta]XP_052368053.1 gasdermin-E-like isoform X7 [Oncorhynchus keta]XP_052368058.1 gasdermin-E-like isoform X11 [Oncorhynchus keta]
MISKAVKSMLKEVDSNGSLIPVSSLNDSSGKLNLLSLIVKTRPRCGCFWQEPKYQSRGFSLSDVLKPGEPEDKPLNPDVKESDFVDHSGTFADKKEMNSEGNVEGLAADLKLNLGLKCFNGQESSFGRLKKEEVEVKEVVNYSKDKRLDMTHPVIKQTREKPRAILGVLTERIMTSQPCPVTNKVRKCGNAAANMSACVALSVKASMKQSGSTQTDSDVSLKIPEYTVVAFSLIELKVKRNGKFELCLFSNNGGFEKVRSNYEIEEDGIMDLVGDFDANSPLNLNKELEKLSRHFQLLSVLPADTRSSLLQLLKTTMEDRETVSVLESVLDQLCEGETPDLGDLEDSERETVQAILDLVDQCVGKDEDEIRSSLLSAVHVIVSAMDGMTDECLSVLGSCCSPPVLQALQILVQHVAAGSGETLSLRDAGLAVLTEEELYQRTESLFALSNVELTRLNEDAEFTVTSVICPGHLLLVMSIAVNGLASLG